MRGEGGRGRGKGGKISLTQFGNTKNAAVNSIRLTVSFINKPHLNLFQEEFKVELQWIFDKIKII